MDLENELSAEDMAALNDDRANNAPVETTPAPVPPAASDTAPAAQHADGTQPVVPAQDTERSTMVPHAALHEERERRKAVEAENRVLMERTTRILEEMAKNQRVAQPAPPVPAAPEIPPLDKDPLGNIVGQLSQMDQQLKALSQGSQQQAEVQRRAAAIMQLQNTATSLENEYRKQTADYDTAAAHLRATRDREFALMGVADPAQRNMMLNQEALNIAASALQRGENPAAVIYALAKERGYTATQAVAQAQTQAPAAVSGEARIQTLAKGQAQAASLGSSRGTAPPALSVQRLLEMDEAEFDKALRTGAGQALMGS